MSSSTTTTISEATKEQNNNKIQCQSCSEFFSEEFILPHLDYSLNRIYKCIECSNLKPECCKDKEPKKGLFWICDICYHAYHPDCLFSRNDKDNKRKKKRKKYWECPSCEKGRRIHGEKNIPIGMSPFSGQQCFFHLGNSYDDAKSNPIQTRVVLDAPGKGLCDICWTDLQFTFSFDDKSIKRLGLCDSNLPERFYLPQFDLFHPHQSLSTMKKENNDKKQNKVIVSIHSSSSSSSSLIQKERDTLSVVGNQESVINVIGIDNEDESITDEDEECEFTPDRAMSIPSTPTPAVIVTTTPPPTVSTIITRGEEEEPDVHRIQYNNLFFGALLTRIRKKEDRGNLFLSSESPTFSTKWATMIGYSNSQITVYDRKNVFGFIANNNVGDKRFKGVFFDHHFHNNHDNSEKTPLMSELDNIINIRLLFVRKMMEDGSILSFPVTFERFKMDEIVSMIRSSATEGGYQIKVHGEYRSENVYFICLSVTLLLQL